MCRVERYTLMGNTYVRLLEIYYLLFMPYIVEIGWHLAKLLQK